MYSTSILLQSVLIAWSTVEKERVFSWHLYPSGWKWCRALHCTARWSNHVMFARRLQLVCLGTLPFCILSPVHIYANCSTYISCIITPPTQATESAQIRPFAETTRHHRTPWTVFSHVTSMGSLTAWATWIVHGYGHLFRVRQEDACSTSFDLAQCKGILEWRGRFCICSEVALTVWYYV